jgi:predicted transcriptional regulator
MQCGVKAREIQNRSAIADREQKAQAPHATLARDEFTAISIIACYPFDVVMGHLEVTVMDLLWERGDGNVHDVLRWLDRPLAYNTVMTTLDRLYKKGLLTRIKRERAYFYAPRLSRLEWHQKEAEDLVSGFLSGPRPAHELLVSCLVDAFGQHDIALLDTLEEKIRLKRLELDRQGEK